MKDTTTRERLVQTVTDTLPRPLVDYWQYGLVAVFLSLPLAPVTLVSNFHLSLLSQLLIFAIFAMSYDILIGYTGIISFGHALPFGVAAYTSGLLLAQTSVPFLPALVAALAVVVLLSVVVGYVSFKLSGVYFSLVTLAVAQLFYEMAVQLTWLTGGQNGLSGVPSSTILVGLVDLGNPAYFYWVALFFGLFTYFSIRRVLDSPIGRVFVSIRENEERARAIGLDVFKFKIAAFTFGGFFAAIAGALYAPYLNFVSSQTLFWSTSGDVLLMTLVGGMGSLWGPAAGASLLIIFQHFISGFTDLWLILLGIFYIVVVIFVPQGLAGIITGNASVKSLSDVIEKIRS